MSDDDNSDQRAFWSGPSGRVWIEREAVQDRLLSEAADAVMARAGIAPSQGVLDIGCGTGALSLRAADAVGPGGRVLATDISAPLLARAAERLAGHRQATTLEADAAVAEWPEPPFDHAISRFGVMFFADPPRAFANIARALRPGGRITFASWAPALINPYWSDTAAIAARHLGRPPKVEQDTPGPMGLADRALTQERVGAGGFTEVSVSAVEIALIFEGAPEALAELLLKVGPAARIANYFEADEATLAPVRRDLADWAKGYMVDGAIRVPATINLIEGRRS